MNFAEFLRTHFFIQYLRWLLLFLYTCITTNLYCCFTNIDLLINLHMKTHIHVFIVLFVYPNFNCWLWTPNHHFRIIMLSLNISTGHGALFSKKLYPSYVRQKLLQNGHNCLVWSFFINSKAFGKPSCSSFSYYEHFNRQFTYAQFFFVFKMVRYVWVKSFYSNILLLFCPVWDSFSSKNILYITK